MNKLKKVENFIILIYSLLLVIEWVNFLFPKFYMEHLHIKEWHNVMMNIGFICFFLSVVGVLINLKRFHVNKGKIIMFLLLLSLNICLIYFSIIRDGDS